MAGIPWSEQDKKFIIDNYQEMSCAEMALHLCRTTRGVQHMFNQLNLKRPIPVVGDKLNRLTIIETFYNFENNQNKTYAKCICDCGKHVIVRVAALANNTTKSCGCLRNDKARDSCIKRNYKHGKSNFKKNRLFRIWCAMKSRCYTKNSANYKNYGQRGIIVCDEWKNNFLKFEEWALQNGYNDILSIDRINVDDIYRPENCKWSTYTEQSQNKRSNLIISAFGETKILAEWLRDKRCLATKINLAYRIKAGWTPELAITTPPLKANRYYGERAINTDIKH